jgi:UDP-N-acetylglucosamine diphosphorylase / glucose-1-phosphate thymidylyltransferase / UDP-N-acetylgalactosamine diphosphorylase / glucosamine-1-phosphate N-acetyltransferase / galactosamine-1-phosphate N-acetyltransferase
MMNGKPEVTKAVILAAGRGTRMRELTQDLPKPMVMVKGKPILQYIIEGLRAAGIEKILLVVGYRKEVVIDHFRDGFGQGVSIEYVEQKIQDGTGRVLELGRDFCGNDAFILSYGDILVDPSIYIPLTKLGEAEMFLTVRYADDVSKGGAVYLNDAFEVIDLREKQNREETVTHWYNAGIYTFRPSIFPFCAHLEKSPRGEYELTDAIRAIAEAGNKIKAIEIKGDWADVRDPEILAELNRETK